MFDEMTKRNVTKFAIFWKTKTPPCMYIIFLVSPLCNRKFHAQEIIYHNCPVQLVFKPIIHKKRLDMDNNDQPPPIIIIPELYPGGQKFTNTIII